MRWFSSDWHLGHANIARFCDRPFLLEDIHDEHGRPMVATAHMNAAIIATANTMVGQGDELWLLGDIAMGNTDHTLAYLSQLRAGKVVLVPGNHDKCHPMKDKKGMWKERYERAGVEVAEATSTLTLEDGTDVLVSHFPYKGDSHDTDRYTQWRPIDDGSWLLCGHVHEKWAQRGRAINVGIDAWGGQLLSEEDIAEIIAQGPQDRDSLRWDRAW